jgi:hypothetical protein
MGRKGKQSSKAVRIASSLFILISLLSFFPFLHSTIKKGRKQAKNGKKNPEKDKKGQMKRPAACEKWKRIQEKAGESLS